MAIDTHDPASPMTESPRATGLTDIVIPERNRADLDDVPENVRNDLTFHPVMSLEEVFELALEQSRDVALS